MIRKAVHKYCYYSVFTGMLFLTGFCLYLPIECYLRPRAIFQFCIVMYVTNIVMIYTQFLTKQPLVTD